MSPNLPCFVHCVKLQSNHPKLSCTQFLKKFSVSSKIVFSFLSIMKVIVLLLFVIQLIYSYKTKQYQRTNVSEFKIGSVFSASSKISCGVACLANSSCEGFNFDGLHCSILSEILVDPEGVEQVWIDPEILGKTKKT